MNERDERGQRKARAMRERETQAAKPLCDIPSCVQLPGGARLSAVPFRVVAWNVDGTPKLFELLPAGETPSAKESGDVFRCALFADEAWIRRPMIDTSTRRHEATLRDSTEPNLAVPPPKTEASAPANDDAPTAPEGTP